VTLLVNYVPNLDYNMEDLQHPYYSNTHIWHLSIVVDAGHDIEFLKL